MISTSDSCCHNLANAFSQNQQKKPLFKWVSIALYCTLPCAKAKFHKRCANLYTVERWLTASSIRRTITLAQTVSVRLHCVYVYLVHFNLSIKGVRRTWEAISFQTEFWEQKWGSLFNMWNKCLDMIPSFYNHWVAHLKEMCCWCVCVAFYQMRLKILLRLPSSGSANGSIIQIDTVLGISLTVEVLEFSSMIQQGYSWTRMESKLICWFFSSVIL